MKIKKGFILKKISNDYVVVPVGDNLVDFKLMITLNSTGSFLWKQLSEDRNFDDLTTALINEYEIDEDTAKSDILEFIKTLEEKSILDK